MEKCLVLFVEGETEVEFYKQLISNIRKKNNLNTFIEYVNTKGIGGFKEIAKRKFDKDIKKKYSKNCQYTIVLCSDTDIFEFSQNPPIDWKKVKSSFSENCVKKVIHIKAKESIEDWFLYDLEGILSFLKLNKKAKMIGKNGFEKLKNLFKQSNKVYVKGGKTREMIAALDIEKISKILESSTELNKLYEVLGVKRT